MEALLDADVVSVQQLFLSLPFSAFLCLSLRFHGVECVFSLAAVSLTERVAIARLSYNEGVEMSISRGALRGFNCGIATAATMFSVI